MHSVHFMARRGRRQDQRARRDQFPDSNRRLPRDEWVRLPLDLGDQGYGAERPMESPQVDDYRTPARVYAPPSPSRPPRPAKQMDEDVFAVYAREDRLRETRELICAQRRERREVILATGKGGRNGARIYKNRSKIKC